MNWGPMMEPQSDPEQSAASAAEPTLEFRAEQKPGLGAGCVRCGAPPKGTLLLCTDCIAEDEREARLRQPRWTPGNLAALKSLVLGVISCAFLVGFWPAAILAPIAFILATDTLIRRKGLSAVGVFLAVLATLPGFLLCGSILRSMHADAVEADNQRSRANNLKRIAQAIVVYTQDYDQRFPPLGDGCIGKPSPRSWESLVRPYIDTRDGASAPGPAGGISLSSRGRGDWTPGAHDSGTYSNYAFCDGHVERVSTRNAPVASDKRNPWAADAAGDQ